MQRRKQILILGAGKSSGILIKQLSSCSDELQTYITVADIDLELAQEKILGLPNCHAVQMNISDVEEIETLISKQFVVISMLPAHLHISIARISLKLKVHLLTASYLTKEMKELSEEVEKSDLLFLNEMGLDPGIDHMSAVKIIDQLKQQGAKVTSFQSYTGGLISEEFCDNPWMYKFTWNPRNVILAGQSTAMYLKEAKIKYLPYRNLFRQIQLFDIPGIKQLEGYLNRDSLSYISLYGLPDVNTMIRGTLRYQGFCKAWDIFVKLGLTDDTTIIQNANNLTYLDWVEAFLPPSKLSVQENLFQFCGIEDDADCQEKIRYSGIFEPIAIPFKEASCATILQSLLEPKLQLNEDDQDLIVMIHQLEYEFQQELYKKQSVLVDKGMNSKTTAMARTVGLPLAIACKLLLKGELQVRGVHVPVIPEIYNPVLDELEAHGIVFEETTEKAGESK